MIVVDGDSVAQMVENHPDCVTKWPFMLGQDRGVRCISLAHAQATAKDCLLRIWRALAERPSWYVLCLGQWSQNHEPSEEFENNVRRLVEAMLIAKVRVCLMTPPVDIGYLHPHLETIRRLGAVYRASLMDLNKHLTDDSAPAPEKDSWWVIDGTVRCHFSEIGAKRVLQYFKLPENDHLCRP